MEQVQALLTQMQTNSPVESQEQPSQQNFSFKQLVYLVFQVKANKPRSVKILQWVFISFALYYLYFFWGSIPMWNFELIIVLSLIIIFALLYTYRLWALYILRIVPLVPIFVSLSVFSYLIYSSGINLTGYSSFTEIVNQQMSDAEINKVINFLFLTWGILSMILVGPILIIYAFLWNQVERYKYLQLKKKSTTS